MNSNFIIEKEINKFNYLIARFIKINISVDYKVLFYLLGE